MNDLLTTEDFIPIGFIGGLHGYDGTVHLVLDANMKHLSDKNLKFLYFKENGMFVPRFIRSWDSEQSLIRFDRIPVREQARFLTDQQVYLRRADLPEAVINEKDLMSQWNLFNGYQIFDEENEVALGYIDAIVEYPAGWMAELNQQSLSGPLLIPLAEPMIDRIDQKNKILYMKLPHGLVDL